MKKFLCFILCLLLVFMLLGCKGENENDILFSSGRFILVSNSPGEAVFYDGETMVMYLLLYGVYQKAVTVLLNADGTPMLYEGQQGGN